MLFISGPPPPPPRKNKEKHKSIEVTFLPGDNIK